MSAGVVNLHAQVESVLGALVKAATMELTRLFESYSGLTVDSQNKTKNECLDRLDRLSSVGKKRSIGVQVGEDVPLQFQFLGPPFLSGADCLSECEEVKVEEGCLIPSDILLTEENGQVDPEWPSLKEEVLTDNVDMVQLNVFENDFPIYSDAKTDGDLQISAEMWTEMLTHESTPNSPPEQKPLVVQPDTLKGGVKFVCPLILKPESPAPKPEILGKSVQAEPKQGLVSTAKGKAYSPSPSDGAVTPARVGVWERIATPKETNKNLQMKLKLTSLDPKLIRPCVVQLVDLLSLSKSETKLQENLANHITGNPPPKDLRRHQGLHTGHRLCCFTSCDNGIWRLQNVVAHSRNGYTCNICRKTFKRRKVLRRHERFHTGEKPYPCSACSKTFALRKSLRRHLRVHTGEKPHRCTQCGKSFRLRENLKAHLRFHTGERPYSCSACGKMFRIIKNLEKHKLRCCVPCVPSFRIIAGL